MAARRWVDPGSDLGTSGDHLGGRLTLGPGHNGSGRKCLAAGSGPAATCRRETPIVCEGRGGGEGAARDRTPGGRLRSPPGLPLASRGAGHLCSGWPGRAPPRQLRSPPGRAARSWSYRGPTAGGGRPGPGGGALCAHARRVPACGMGGAPGGLPETLRDPQRLRSEGRGRLRGKGTLRSPQAPSPSSGLWGTSLRRGA